MSKGKKGKDSVVKAVVAKVKPIGKGFDYSALKPAALPVFEQVKANQEWSFLVRTKAKDVNTVISIDGQKRPVTAGSYVKAQLSALDVPETIKAIFEGILPKADLTKGNLALAIKAGYSDTHFGIIKGKVPNSWHGVVTYTDKQLCWHSWPEKGILWADLDQLRQDNSIPLNRKGNNWLTLSFSKSNAADCIKASLALINLANK